MSTSKATSSIDLDQPSGAEITSLGFSINGKRVFVIGDYRMWLTTKTTRRALDFNKGTLELRFNEGYGPDAICYEEEPDELEFYCTDTRGNAETWRAYYKARNQLNPKTDKPESYRPFYFCRVRLVQYDEVERAWMERKEHKREQHRRALAEEAQRQKAYQEQAELDRNYKQSMISLAGKAGVDGGRAEPTPPKKKPGRPRKDHRPKAYPKPLMNDWLRNYFSKFGRRSPNRAVEDALKLFDEKCGDPVFNTMRPPWKPRQFWEKAAQMKEKVTGRRS